MVTDSITLTENNKMVSEDMEVANIFNNFFSTAVKGLNIDYYEHFSWDCVFSESEDPITKAIEKYSKHPSIVKIKERYSQNSFSFQPTDFEAVFKEIKNLDVSKSSPMESLPARAIRDLVDVLCPKIVIDFNSAIQTGIFPENPKQADVVPVYKKDVFFLLCLKYLVDSFLNKYMNS